VSRRAVALALALFAARAPAAEKLGVIAVADPPLGPDGDLAELAHQLRAACRDRVGGVEEVAAMRGRLLGQISDATVSELDRAYGGALAVYQNGEFESSLRTLRAIVEDLESLPESEESYFQWKRALLRLAHAAITVGLQSEADRALEKLARTEPTYQPDPDSFSPGFRRRLEDRKAKLRLLPRRKLLVLSEGRPGTVYVNGREMGRTPLALTLPAGRYRIGGASVSFRVPSFQVDLEPEDRTVVLDFALAESLRVNAGPGLALAPAGRAYGVIRAGAWLDVDKLVVVSRVEEGEAQFLLGSIYDVRRGTLLREGSVRMVAGGVPSVNMAALASFLLTGQSSREVKDLSLDVPKRIVPPQIAVGPGSPLPLTVARSMGKSAPQPPEPPHGALRPRVEAPNVEPASAAKGADAAVFASSTPASITAPVSGAPAPLPPSLEPAKPSGIVPKLDLPDPERHGSRAGAWMRPAAIGAGVVALGLAGFAIQQKISSSKAYSDAEDMLGSGGNLKPGLELGRYRDLKDDGDAGRRNAYISAGAAAAFAVTAGILGWRSARDAPDPAAVAFHF
jgi:hypothetical protein